MVLPVLHDTDDFSPFSLDGIVPEALSDGILAGQELPSKRFINEYHAPAPGFVVFVKIAPGDQAGLGGLQKAWGNHVNSGQRDVSRLRDGLALNENCAVA